MQREKSFQPQFKMIEERKEVEEDVAHEQSKTLKRIPISKIKHEIAMMVLAVIE